MANHLKIISSGEVSLFLFDQMLNRMFYDLLTSGLPVLIPDPENSLICIFIISHDIIFVRVLAHFLSCIF